MDKRKHGRRPAAHVNRLFDAGPFDIIGDVHGCFDELVELLQKLDYAVEPRTTGPGWLVRPPGSRKLVFVGDLVDRGPAVPDVLRLVMGMVAAGTALCVPGNHDDKLMRKLLGHDVQIKHGLDKSLEQLAPEPPRFISDIIRFFEHLPSHYVLDGGRLVVAHAGLKEEYQGHTWGRVREFALYGETAGKLDELGLMIRYNWAGRYSGKAAVVYGHMPIRQAEWQNNTIDIDTGCVFGGALTALRWPERELVSVPARETYAQPGRPMKQSVTDYPVQPAPDGASAPHAPETRSQ